MRMFVYGEKQELMQQIITDEVNSRLEGKELVPLVIPLSELRKAVKSQMPDGTVVHKSEVINSIFKDETWQSKAFHYFRDGEELICFHSDELRMAIDLVHTKMKEIKEAKAANNLFSHSKK